MTDSLVPASGALVALVFFRQIGKTLVTSPMTPADLGYWVDVVDNPNRFPSSPFEAQKMAYRLLEFTAPGESSYVIHEQCEWDLTDMPAAVGDLFMRYQPHVKAQQIMTVHAKSMLLRLLRWYLLRDYSPSQIGMVYNQFAGKTLDLCEAFHFPAILRFEERAAFNTRLIARALAFPDEASEDAVLTRLVARML